MLFFQLCWPPAVSDAASKHAVQAFFDCLRAEVQESGISVSTISHTFINAAPTIQHSTTSNSILSGKSTSWTITSHKPNKHTIPVDFCPVVSCWLKSAILTGQKPHGISPEEMANAILQALGSKKKEIIMAHSISKAAIYTRSLFPNLFFAIMAAGVRNAAGVEPVQWNVTLFELYSKTNLFWIFCWHGGKMQLNAKISILFTQQNGNVTKCYSICSKTIRFMFLNVIHWKCGLFLHHPSKEHFLWISASLWQFFFLPVFSSLCVFHV